MFTNLFLPILHKKNALIFHQRIHHEKEKFLSVETPQGISRGRQITNDLLFTWIIIITTIST